jgi:outer membrane protein assembly factor BamB
MTMIELGDVAPGSAPAPERTREFDRRIVRRFAPAAVAVLTLLGATASSRPAPPLIRTLWSIPFSGADRYAVGAGTLYAATQDTAGRLTAYGLTDGAVRWSIEMPESSAYPNVAPDGSVVLLPADRQAVQVKSGDDRTYLSETYRETAAVDERTGAELWRGPGDVFAVTGDTVLLADWSDEGNTISSLRLVRIADGSVRWSRPSLGRVHTIMAGGDARRPGFLITVRPQGAAEVIRLADGVTIASGRLDWTTGSFFDGDLSDLGADDRNVYVRRADGPGSSLTAYALDSLRQRWRVVTAARVSAYPCGRVLCSEENDGLAAYDPITGATRWRAVGVRYAWAVGDGRLLAADRAQDVYTLLDDLTGEPIAPPSRGQPVQDEAGGTILLIRNTRAPTGRTAVSTVDPRTGRVALRGTIDQVAEYGCAVRGHLLICPTADGRLAVSAVG